MPVAERHDCAPVFLESLDVHRIRLGALVRKLERWAPLDARDQAAILALPHQVRALDSGHHLVWEGDRPQHCCVLLSGFAFRHKSAGHGGRQILSVHMPGDAVDLQNSLLGVADHGVQMLTAGDVALIPIEAVKDIAFAHPPIGLAMWYDTLVDGSIFREWITNVGQRDARTRIAHLLCEIGLRLEQTGLADRSHYELPITQEQLADAVGLTSVHVNRTLKALGEDGYITRSHRMISVSDWTRLAKVGDFNARYLHVEGLRALA